MDASGLHVAGFALAEHDGLAIGHQTALALFEELNCHLTLDHDGHVVARMRVRRLGAARLPLLEHDLDAVGVTGDGRANREARRCIGRGDVMPPYAAGCRGHGLCVIAGHARTIARSSAG
jgi:hypothetical protein